eukprot:1107645-Pelagomonas_calceolata.AAC.5
MRRAFLGRPQTWACIGKPLCGSAGLQAACVSTRLYCPLPCFVLTELLTSIPALCQLNCLPMFLGPIQTSGTPTQRRLNAAKMGAPGQASWLSGGHGMDFRLLSSSTGGSLSSSSEGCTMGRPPSHSL